MLIVDFTVFIIINIGKTGRQISIHGLTTERRVVLRSTTKQPCDMPSTKQRTLWLKDRKIVMIVSK